jgi:hypothetical protein
MESRFGRGGGRGGREHGREIDREGVWKDVNEYNFGDF